jgi:hypothetical protein
MRKAVFIFILTQFSIISYGQIVADHTIVDKFDKIPQYYIDQVKKMWLVYAGESHAYGVRLGLGRVQTLDARYAVNATEGIPIVGTSPEPEAYTTSHLRVSSGTWGDHDNATGWIYWYGEEDWWSNSTAISQTETGISYCNANNLTISAMGFGWCWDAMGTGPTASADPLYGCRWWGSSVNGPSGHKAWGIDAGDYSITTNLVNMDTYISVTQGYIDYCTANDIPTKVFFTTGPVDNYNGNYIDENMFQAHLKYEHIRDYIDAHPNTILFDYADILCYDNDGTLTTATWNGNTYPRITSTNLTPGGNAHISAAGELRLGKAMWWMLARMAGWDGSYTWQGTSDSNFGNAANWLGGVVPPDGSDISFAANPDYDCLLDKDRQLNNVTITQGTKIFDLSGHQLTISGTLVISGGARLKASTILSTLVYGGSSGQTIETGQLINNEVYNLTNNNQGSVTLNTDLSVNNNLTINVGNITVQPSQTLSVYGHISNYPANSGVVIKSDATGEGKLICNNNPINGTVELYLTGNYGASGPVYHYFVPPVQSMSIGSTISEVKSSLSLTNFFGDLMFYAEPAAQTDQKDGWKYFDGYLYGNTPSQPFTSLVCTKGYNIYLRAADKIIFTGPLNWTQQSYSLSYTEGTRSPGWNLVGNPFPCNLNLNSLPELATYPSNDGIDNTVYLTIDGGYGYWNVSNHVGLAWTSDIVPSMQGFFIHVTSANKTLVLPVNAKTSTSTSSRAKGEVKGDQCDLKAIKLTFYNGTKKDETLVCLVAKATEGFDTDFDAYKLFGNSTVPYIYTEMGDIKYAINSVPEPDLNPIVIPISLIVQHPGISKIDVSEFDNMDGFKVILKHGGSEKLLTKDISYEFTTDAGTFTDFQLIIINGTVGIDEHSELRAVTRYNNQSIFISCSNQIQSGNYCISIYDLNGRIFYKNNFLLESGAAIQIPVGNLPPGIYLTCLQLENEKYVSKFIVY